MVSMVSSLIFLIGLALIYAAAGNAQHGRAFRAPLMDVSEGTRSALPRCCWWRSGSRPRCFHLDVVAPTLPTAPAPVTAVFAGLLTKVGVYAIIRAHSLLFPSGGLDAVLLVAALLTMLVGILATIAQNDINGCCPSHW